MRKDLEHNEYRQMRRIVFLAVVVSTAAVISAVITLPMLYGFIQTLENHLLLETHFCKSRSSDMWSEITALQIGKKLFSRIKREWSFGKWMSSGSFYGDTGNDGASNNGDNSNNYGSIPIDPLLNGNYYGQCCTCHKGAAGPPGPEGEEGKKGMDGYPGRNGKPGKDSKIPSFLLNKNMEEQELCMVCPP
ncbi:unnamed protein product, partial [Wuchereria bancrofti]